MGQVIAISESKLDQKRKQRLADTKAKTSQLTLRNVLNGAPRKVPKAVSSENDQRAVLANQLRKLRRIAKTLEDAFEIDGNGRVVYQLMQVYQKVNETMAEIRNLKSPEIKVGILTTKLAEPTFRNYVNILTDLTLQMRKLAVSRAPTKLKRKVGRQIDELVLGHSNVIQALYEKVQERITMIVKEDL